jgi:hypothetical protein
MNIKQLILETNRLEKQQEATQAHINKNLKEIQAYFDEKKIKELDVVRFDASGQNGLLHVVKVERLNITYNVDKLRETLDKERFNEVVTRDYYVHDLEKLKSKFKQAGLSSKDLRECIGVIETVNKAAIQQMYSLGDITLKEIKLCSSSTLSKYIQIKEKKGDKD